MLSRTATTTLTKNGNKIMQENINRQAMVNTVTAVFLGRSIQIEMGEGATFGDLADRIGNVRDYRSGRPKAIYFRIGMTDSRGPGRQHSM